MQDGTGLIYEPGALPPNLDLSPRALRRWRITINYSWTVGHHTVRAVDTATRTIHFEQKATAGGGAFWWLENLPELWPAAGAGGLRPSGPVCTQTTPADEPCTPSKLPWMLVEGAEPGVATELRLHSANATHPPVAADDSLVIATMAPPLLLIHGQNGTTLDGMSFSNLHLAHARDPCPSSRDLPGTGTGSSQAWNNPLITPEVPRGSVNNPACDCLMVVGGIETGTRSAFSASYTSGLSLTNMTVSRVGGSGISIARSSNAKVVRAHVFQVGANGLEFSRVQGASLSQSVVTGYGLVLMGAAAVELDQSPATVEHNVRAATVGLGLGCCRDV